MNWKLKMRSDTKGVILVHMIAREENLCQDDGATLPGKELVLLHHVHNLCDESLHRGLSFQKISDGCQEKDTFLNNNHSMK